MAKQHIPGVSLAVVRDGKVTFTKGYGFANLESMRRASPESVFQLASVTKQFTATAVMMLVEEGKIRLEEPIRTYLTDLPEAWGKVTVRNLLNHTSGIKSYTDLPGFFDNGNQRRDYTPNQIIDLVRNLPPDFEPGTQWHYNNTGYYLLGMLIEQVTGQKYDQFLTQRIFKPLGMAHTRLNNRYDLVPERVIGYSWSGKAWVNAEFVSPTQPFSAGALLSTVLDMAKWDAALYTTKLLKAETLQQMWTPTILKSGEKQDYGFGWIVSKVNKHRMVVHGGGIDGFNTYISRYPEDRLTVIVLTNTDEGHAEKIALEVSALYEPALKVLPTPHKPIADDNPKRTELLKGIMLEAAQGRANADLFTPTAAQILIPRIQALKQAFAEVGAMQSFVLVEKRQEKETTVLRYLVKYAHLTISTIYALNSEGKIEGIRFQNEE